LNSLSVVVITYNEERNIGRCLDSVKGIADEIVVIDSFSTDRTREVCAGFGARFIEHQFAGHIEQKNFAVGQAAFHHILSLDADEALSERLRDSILRTKEEWTFRAYRMNRMTSYCGTWIRHGAWYPDRKIRLFDSRAGAWSGRNPHDRFQLTDAGARIGNLAGDILHYSYASISDHVRQVDYFTGISANELFTRGKSAGLAHLLFAPPIRFLRDYFYKRGFLDGFYGFVIAMISAHSVFIKYVKLHELRKTKGIPE